MTNKYKIKLIASDLDGTLLDSHKQLPQNIFSYIERLYDCGVYFLPASGRQYANLKKLFAPVADKVFFLCENGALVKHRDQTIFLNAVNDNDVIQTLHAVRSVPHLFPVLCGVTCAYIENDEIPFANVTRAAYTNCQKVSNLDDVIGREPICKISVFDAVSAAENAMQRLPSKLPSLRVMQSGFEWCDVSAPDCNKGKALMQLCKIMKIEQKNCIAFGDHMNDYEMLLACGTPYVTQNAFPFLKEKFCNVIPSNDEYGVLTKLKEILSSLEGESL